MTARNAYATLAEYKAYVTARGQTASTDASDDGVIESLLENASRFLDDETGRQYYPVVQVRYFDVPDGRELMVDDDLLEIITLTNGDSTTMPSTEYYMVPRNYTPAYGVKITDVSTYTWISNSAGSMENAISIEAIWAYRYRYASEGWKAVTVTTEALDTSEVEFDVSSSTLFSAGQIIRYGNELGIVASTAANKVTVLARGDNGSTAAAHDSGITIYIWQPEAGAKEAALEIANQAYLRRFGKSVSNAETITAAGVVLSPRDIPTKAMNFIRAHRSMV